MMKLRITIRTLLLVIATAAAAAAAATAASCCYMAESDRRCLFAIAECSILWAAKMTAAVYAHPNQRLSTVCVLYRLSLTRFPFV